MGLESLNENLPEIKVELVFAQRRLEFKPPLEQIRQTYYNEMRKFAGIPAAFDGFGNADVYRTMGARNSARLATVFSKAELLFDRLAAMVARYSPLVRLGQVDLDAFVEEHVTAPEQFILNFKALRGRRKDADKLPDSERVGCCLVSLVPLKTFLDDLGQSVSDTLLITLRRSLLNEFKEVDTFLETSNEKLSSRPHTVEEIGNAKRDWKEIDNKKDEMRALSRRCVEKKKLLLQYSPGSSVDTSEVRSHPFPRPRPLPFPFRAIHTNTHTHTHTHINTGHWPHDESRR